MHSYLLAFGFANLAILGWLGAAAAPILIHLWMKRVRKETRWAAIRFLQAAIKRHARRLQLQQWVLLAIRTAIILLVVLAAAKPVLDALPLGGPGVRTHRMLVMDASMSMNWRAEDGRLIDRAKRLATQLIDQSRPGDTFSVCVLSSSPQTLLGVPTSDPARARAAVGGVTGSAGHAPLAAGLALVQEVLAQAEATAAQIDRTEITFFTDLAAHTWDQVAAGAQGEAADRYADLVDQAMLSIVDVGQPGAGNVAVVQAAIEDAAPTTQRPLEVRAQVKRFGGDAPQQEVDLVVDGLTVATESVTFDDAGEGWIAFAHPVRTPGVHELAVRIGEDNLPGDDQRAMACTLVDRVRVLCIEGRGGAGRYVARALNPSGAGDAPIQVEVVSDAALASIDFAEYPCVFFCNVAQLSSAEADRLAQYVDAGGGAVFFLGDRVLPERYNEVFSNRGAETDDPGSASPPSARRAQPAGLRVTPVALQGAQSGSQGLLPTRVGRAVSDAQFRLDPLEYAHPIVSPFRGRERAGLITTPVSRYYKLGIPPDSATDIALATTGGDALIATHAYGQGRVVVVATDGALSSVDPATGEPWTLMPAWPSFLPIVRELLSYSIGEPAGTLLVGEPWLVSTPPGIAGGALVVTRPGGEQESMSVSANQGTLEYPRTDETGVYRARADSTPAAVAAVAVNPDPRESDLRRVPLGSLPAELQRRSVTGADDDRTQLVAPTGIHRGLLLAALALVLVETLLAYLFGRSAG